MISNHERQEGMNRLARAQPEVGDKWVEMLRCVCIVQKVEPDLVTFLRADGTTTQMSKHDFAAWLSYKSIPDQTWADWVGKAKR